MPALGLGLYRLAAWALAPFAGPVLRLRAARGKEDPARLAERLGVPGRARPEGSLVWLHGVSVGESMMLATLADALAARRPDLNLLVTTGTRTAAEMMAKRLPLAAIHQYAPVDAPHAVARFLDHWKPDLGVFAESELWPNLLLGAQARGVKLALINARMTEKSLKRWRGWPDTARALVGAFDTIAAADQRTLDGLRALGARDIALTGNLKAAAEPPAADGDELATLTQALHGRLTWLAASTHPGEEEIVIEAHRRLAEMKDAHPLLIIAPRHPGRGPEVAGLAAEAGCAVSRRGAGDAPSMEDDVYVADTLGEMGLWLRLADAVFMGGSLVPGIGGHNPLEPALLRAPIVVGPQTFNFEAIYAQLIAANGAGLVHNASELAEEIRILVFEDASARVEAAEAAVGRGGDVLESVMGRLGPLLPDARDARSA